MFPSLTMCTQLCTLRTGIIVMQFKVQAGNRNGEHQFPGLWDGRWTVLNPGIQSAKSRPQRKLKMEMSLYSRSTTVIHHVSPWLIRHNTLSVRVRQFQAIVADPACNVCTPMISGYSWLGQTMS